MSAIQDFASRAATGGRDRLPAPVQNIVPRNSPTRTAHPHARQSDVRPLDPHQWLVDVSALARCRSLFSRRGADAPAQAAVRGAGMLTLMDVPASYDQFCRAHFTTAKRLHPALTWEDACPAYAIALSAHASLRRALDDECERQLGECWDSVRGQSCLAWPEARPLIADGCRALDRLDPLAMRR